MNCNLKIALIYESDEWSNQSIADLLHQKWYEVEYLNIENIDPDNFIISNYDILINRVFPSAEMRGHFDALAKTFELLNKLEVENIPVITGLPEFEYDCDKYKSYLKMVEAGIEVPKFQLISNIDEKVDISYPLLAKQLCGGRSWNMKYIESSKSIGELKIESPCLIQEFIIPDYDFITRIEFFGYDDYFVLKRILDGGKIGSYSRNSTYEIYESYSDELINTSIKALKSLNIEMGSLDIIEKSGKYYVIDANATSNFSKDYIELLGFNPIEKMVNYYIKKLGE